jgi:hypothetical protein
MASLSVANGPSNGAVVAVGEVQSSLPKPDLAGVKAVESHTKALGIIHPPPDIRAIVDKTAAFVAKNGGGTNSNIWLLLHAGLVLLS